MSKQKYFIILSAILAIMTAEGIADEYMSYFFTPVDVVFFAYEDGTSIALMDSAGNPVTVDPCELDKGGHVIVYKSLGIYKVITNKKLSVLTGDATSRYACGYYAMDAKGRGVSKEFYTYVPSRYYSPQKFVVFAYQDNTTVTVKDSTNQFNATFVLQKGGHWTNVTLSNKFVHVTADKAVSALTCFDNEYFVPSANGRCSGKEFYTCISKIGDWDTDLTVIAYDNNTFARIKDTDTNEIIWEGTLNSGQAKWLSYISGINKYFTITASNPVTVCALQWKSWTQNYNQEVFIPDINGTGIGKDLIGPTLDFGYTQAYLNILAHIDDTHADIYNSQSGEWQASYTLNAGEYVNANPGNGLWRIISDKAISTYSGALDDQFYGYDYIETAEFAPLSFNQKPSFFDLIKDNNDPNNDCVEPWDPNKQNYLTFDIHWSANGYADTNVLIVDKLPYELDYNWSSYECDYNEFERKITWNIGSIDANDSGHIVLKIKVNRYASPCGQISNVVEMEGDSY